MKMKKAKVILDRNNKRGGTELRDESQWVQEVLQGNKEAFAFIIDRYKQRIYAFIYRICRNKHDAQDWTQEVFIRAYRYLQSYRQDKPFSAWIYKIAVNTCNTQLQKKKAYTRETIEEIPATNTTDSPEEKIVNCERKKELQQALDQLPEHYRMVIMLRYMDDLSYKEIGEILQLPMTTVQNHLHRARKQLQKHLAGLVQQEGGKVYDLFKTKSS
jgi:RNA polymerase sigma-70 factor (ECF subfamily)